MRLQLHVITVSDRVSRGESIDASGPAIISYITQHDNCASFREAFAGGITVSVQTVPDEKAKIQHAITSVTSSRGNSAGSDNDACLILTTGGTGFAPRDVTPEAVEPLLEKKAPSLVHAMLSHGLNKHTPCAWLSRAVAGVVASSSCLVITLPGSPKAVVECLEPLVASGLTHAIKLLVSPTDAHPPMVRKHDDQQQQQTQPQQQQAPSAMTASVSDRSRKSDFPIVSVKTALDAIVQHTPSSPVTTRSKPVANSIGHILAQDAISTFPHPPFRASIKDGYAVVASDGTGVFPVAASFCAGADIAALQSANFKLQAGTVCRVNTGGPIPDGADAVIQVEDTDLVEKTADGKEEAKIRVNIAASKVGQDIRPIGCDVAAGATVVAKGTELTTSEIALLNSIGLATVSVVAKPRVAILSTGDELIDAAASQQQQQQSTPAAGKIYDSNRPMLLKAAEPYSSAVIDLGIAKDVHGETRDALERGFAAADIIISTGGVSMGEVDWVKKCLLDSGAEIHFGRVAMKPGKPTTFASRQGKLFFALPGNPVSAMVCFYLFVVPALRKWAGFKEVHLPQTVAKTLEPLKPDSERTEYHRVSLRFDVSQVASTGGGGGGGAPAQLVATSTGIQASHRLLSMAGANGLLVIPPGKEAVPAGSVVPCMIVGPIGV